jgi:periplasmic divalent cation tolerance protein
MTVMFVYATASDAEEASRIARAVVEERLAACANIIERIHSIYWWQDTVQDADEAALILKTTEERLGQLIARIKALHSYDCPCIEAIPVAQGHPAFLDWVAQETR